MPLTAALSSVLIAMRIASSLGWLVKIASSALRTMVFTRDRYIWLRRCLRSFDRIRFSDDLVFAKVTILPYNVPQYNVQHLNGSGYKLRAQMKIILSHRLEIIAESTRPRKWHPNQAA